MSRADYEWTRRRMALAAVIVVAAGVFVGFMARHQLRDLQEGLEADATYARFLEIARDDQADSFNLDDLQIDRQDIAFGGPVKDGIPSLTNPPTVPVGEAEHLAGDDRVIGVTLGGVARAYPIRALRYHEAVNDVLGGLPIAVVYCPLCDSVSVVDRRLDGETYEFGVSGLLVNSNVLVYDRTDDALWSQLGFTAISGPNAGRSLPHLPWELTTFAAWRDAHPRSTVTTFDTGYRRDYDRDPYGDYFESDRLIFRVDGRDDRLTLKTPVVGVKLDDTVRAYPAELIHAGGEVRDVIGRETIVLQADPETGTIRVVEAPQDAFVVHTFWFSWAAFHPETEVYGQP